MNSTFQSMDAAMINKIFVHFKMLPKLICQYVYTLTVNSSDTTTVVEGGIQKGKHQ